MFVSFGMFILACGATHIMEVWTLWHGIYWLSGSIKAVTAMASVLTAILLVKLVPEALALPSPEAMKLEIAERKRTEQALHQAKNELELRVLERTAELRKANEDLVAEIAQRKQIEDVLREREGLIHAILDNSPALIFLKDMEERYLLVNKEFERAFGVSQEEIRGKKDE
jgi:PAS domain-containing protein